VSWLLPPVASVEHATAVGSLFERPGSAALHWSGPHPAEQSAGSRAHLSTTNVNESVPTWMSLAGARRESGHPGISLRVRVACMPITCGSDSPPPCELLTRGVAIQGGERCGFADQSHLSRRFKSVYRVTPATWAAGSASGGTTPAVSLGEHDFQ
jgi:hypothetical protein